MKIKAKKVKSQKSEKAANAENKKITPAVKAVSDDDFSGELSGELNEPRWSVVSFEKIKVRNMTYHEAARKLKEFAADGISGLCIVTDEAASRI